MELGLYYYNARYYVPGIGRFASADTIVPQPGNPQSLNRYTYSYNNPVKYVDPTGHMPTDGCQDEGCNLPDFLDAESTWIDAEGSYYLYDPKLNEPNYPYNKNVTVNSQGCNLDLASCFAHSVPHQAKPVVWLKDFAANDASNPISEAEFTALVDIVADDLHGHDLTSPGIRSGRREYDTPFYNGGGRDHEPQWSADQQACIETYGCYGRSDINYFAQGMWSATTGESLEVGHAVVFGWKATQYQELPSQAAIYWFDYGYSYYQERYDQ